MADTLDTPVGCPTTIATLHAAYVRASEAYTVNDRVCFGDIAPREELIRQQAMDTLHLQTNALSLAILRENPTCMADAVLVAFHATAAADLVTNATLHAGNEEAEALSVMTENMLTFLLKQDGGQIEPEGWLAEHAKYSTERNAARYGELKLAA